MTTILAFIGLVALIYVLYLNQVKVKEFLLDMKEKIGL